MATTATWGGGRLGGVALALALCAAGVAAAPAAPAAGAAVDDRLVFTRADGTAVEFPTRVRVWCGPWEPGVATPAIHLLVGRRGQEGRPAWTLTVARRDARPGRRFTLPLTFVFDRPRGLQLFAYDAADGNEASTGEEEARGSIVLRAATCGPNPRIAFTADAVLGSELSDKGTIRVRGTFSAAARP